MAAPPGRNDPCPCGSGRKYKKCCLDRDLKTSRLVRHTAGAVVETGSPPVSLAAEMTLIVRTPTGMAVRRIPTARPLPGRADRGYEAEDASSDAATVWGLPDFACTIGALKKGSGTREVADRLLVVGQTGVVVQVKARVEMSDSPEKEVRWLHKQVKKAISQGHGTVRTLRNTRLTATTARGTTIDVGAHDRQWLTVVILDHPTPPDGVTPDLGDGGDVCVMLRRDWEFLFDQLKSTNAVIGYLTRTRGKSIELGTEPARYYDLAQADARATPGSVDVTQLGAGGRAYSEPLLPLKPVGHDPGDLNALRLVRAIMEDLAISPMSGASEATRQEALAALDRVPVGQRVELGHLLMEWMEVVADDADAVRMRRLTGLPGGVHMGFGVAGRLNQEMFSLWLQLRHYELQQRTGSREDQVSIGVQLTPRHGGNRRWDTTMISVSGEIDFTADELVELRSVFNGEE